MAGQASPHMHTHAHDQETSAAWAAEAKGDFLVMAALQRVSSGAQHDVTVGFEPVTDGGIKKIIEMLETKAEISSIALVQCDLTGEGAYILGQQLLKDTHCTTLSLHGNTGIGGEAISYALRSSRIRYLDLARCAIHQLGGQALGRQLNMSVNSPLLSVDVSDNVMGEDGGVALLPALLRLPSLVTLKCANNGFGIRTARAAALELTTNTSVTTLDISNNGLGVFGTMAIAGAIAKNNALQTLNMSSLWMLGTGGSMEALSNGIAANTGLQSLDISHNMLGNESAVMLIKGILKNTSLKELSCARNVMDDNGVEILAFGKARNLKLDIRENFASAACVDKVHMNGTNVNIEPQLRPLNADAPLNLDDDDHEYY